MKEKVKKRRRTTSTDIDERLKPFMWFVPELDAKNKKLYWIFLIILLVVEIYLGGSMFFK